ncbi:MAG TPA: hypothetical protein VG248_02235 [Caulobacteraceae bacterium]|jgi:hypothetical protein|nr:hypothetical protein [Caulobacteraceae bacterium]
MPRYDSETRTRTLARIIGPYLIAMAVMVFVRHASLLMLFPAFMENGPLVLATGAFALMAGLAVVGVHHHWRGAAAIAISLVGVIAALKGAALMIVPELGAQISAGLAGAPTFMLVVAALVLVVGLWLSVVGWNRRAAEPVAG